MVIATMVATAVNELESIGAEIRAMFDAQSTLREQALTQARDLTRQCATTIRAIHRQEWEPVRQRLQEIRQSADALKASLADEPGLYYAGYTQDALKEYVEVFLTEALIQEKPLPTASDLDVIPSTYINGLCEAASELRRSILDVIRAESPEDGERMLDAMDAVYTQLITMDYPDAVTGGLRRRTDALRGVLERTRGDLTMSLRQQTLEKAIESLVDQLD